MNWRFVIPALLVACGGTAPPPQGAPPPPAPVVAAAPAVAPSAPQSSMTLAQSGIVEAWLDRGVDPCKDFFEHACGGFLRTEKIPADRSIWGAQWQMQKEAEDLLIDVLDQAARDPGTDAGLRKLGDFYAACTDEATIEKAGLAPLRPFLAIIAKVDGPAGAARAVIELSASGMTRPEYDGWPFFSIGQTQDYADATKVVAYIDQSGLGLPDRDYYLEDAGNMKSVRQAYREHVQRMFVLTGARPAEARAAAADVMRIETALARLHQDKVTRRDPHAVFHRVDRAGLEKLAPDFPWGQYLEALGVGGVTAIAVNDPSYLGAVMRLIAKERPPALRRYLTFHMAANLAPLLGKAFVEEDHRLDRVLRGTEEMPPRRRRCMMRVDEDLGDLLGQQFVARRFTGDSKARAADLVRAVIEEMARHVETLTWMDGPTRAAARAKATRMSALVGFPDRWREYPFAVRRDDHAGNVLAAARFERSRQLGKIGKPVDRGDWEMTAPTVNAYYSANLNQMALPAGILQPPAFGASFHPAVNFGATAGGTVGHELTHGFDDEGSQFDLDGNLRDWWSPATKAAFEEAAECVVDQYARYEAVPGVHLNGKLTAGENIADIGGVKIGLQAYRAWVAAQQAPPPAEVEGLSDDQLYFLSYAQTWCAIARPEILQTMAMSDPHSPPRWRVNGVIVDQPEFAKVYHCAAGTPMNPGKTCEVW